MKRSGIFLQKNTCHAGGGQKLIAKKLSTEWYKRTRNDLRRKEYYAIGGELRLHPAGFVEYKLHRPKVDGDLGWYYEMRGEILNEPDEILLTYFSEFFAP